MLKNLEKSENDFLFVYFFDHWDKAGQLLSQPSEGRPAQTELFLALAGQGLPQWAEQLTAFLRFENFENLKSLKSENLVKNSWK